MYKDAYNPGPLMLYSALSSFSSSMDYPTIRGLQGSVSETLWICEVFGYYLRKDPL